jgi:S1-C subfamily serine protease
VRNLKGKRTRADLVWHDKYTDIAILNIEDELGLKNIKIGSSNVNINDKVYYFDIINKEIENGIITSLDNEINVNSSYGNSLYKANSIVGNIVEGNSGSPVLNNEDEVIGMISLKEENQNKAYYYVYK